MTNGRKGAILGGAAMIAITVIWAVAAGSHEGECIGATGWPDGCQCDPVSPTAIFLTGLVVGTPWGVIVGALLGTVAGRLTPYRKPALALAAPATALILAMITAPFMSCLTDAHGAMLFARAFVPLALAALALERWTREPDPLPIARLR
jgi:hypothetical protein